VSASVDHVAGISRRDSWFGLLNWIGGGRCDGLDVCFSGEGGGEQESVVVAHLCAVRCRHHGRSGVEGIRGRQHTVVACHGSVVHAHGFRPS
jgi:hypothetical protein